MMSSSKTEVKKTGALIVVSNATCRQWKLHTLKKQVMQKLSWQKNSNWIAYL